MYATLLFAHSIFRWLVLLMLLLALYRATTGYFARRPFTQFDNAVRRWTATTLHLQLILGMLLYVKSPLVRFFWNDPAAGLAHEQAGFFGGIHFMLMFTAVVFATIGSARAKRQSEERAKYRTMLRWFAAALILIVIAIPWPFSPLAQRGFFPR